MEVDEVVVALVGGVADVDNEENVCENLCQEHTEEEEGGEADGGYSSNSCNGGEDHHECEGSQDDYDPFNDDGMEQTNGRGTDFEGDRPVDGQRNGSTEELESQDADDRSIVNGINCNGDDVSVSETDFAFLGDVEGHLKNPLEEENSQNWRKTSMNSNLAAGGCEKKVGDKSQMDDDGETEEEDYCEVKEQYGEERVTKKTNEHFQETGKGEGEEQFMEEGGKYEVGDEDEQGKEEEQERDEESSDTISEGDATKENEFLEANVNDDEGGEMSIRIGSVASIQTIVHDDLEQWGANLEGGHEGEESEDVWEDGIEKEINDLNEKEATDSDEEYDEAIMKAMQDSLAKEAEEKGEKEKNDFYEQANDQEDELTLDGVPEVAETVGFEENDEVDEDDMDESNPLDDIDPYLDESEDTFDPLNGGADDIGTDENTSGFLDQVNSGALLVDLPKQVRGPYKKKRSINDTEDNDTEDDDEDDEDFDEYQPFDDEPAIRKSGSKPSSKNEVFFKCDVCSFPFETIGQMKIHKYADHENEEKPSFLDLAEAAIMCKKNRKIGVSKNIILQEALKDPSVTDSKQKAAYLLGKALKAGVQKGRLMFAKHQPKNGGKNYRLVTKPNRRKILAKWSRHKKSVEYRDVDDFGKRAINDIDEEKLAAARSFVRGTGLQITPVLVPTHDPKKFGRGKRTPQQRNSQFPEVRLIDTDESSGDEIMVVSEKITPKTKMRLKMRQQKRQLASQAARGTRGRGSWRGRPRGRGAGRPPTAKNIPRKVEPSVAKADTFEDDDDDLTCRICLSSFWYRTQVLEHLGKTHSVKDPEAFIKERRSRV